MKRVVMSTVQKALAINQSPDFYGTFAEIGGGQEVARHFFQAGKASGTIAKTMSAYDMVFSDSIYGKAERYVSEQRLRKMLNHEFKLLKERLNEKRGGDCRFFTFANTVAIFTGDTKSHGWMGVRFQTKPKSPHNDIILHIELKDRTRLQKQEVIGLLGVNLLYAIFNFEPTSKEFLVSLLDNISIGRVEINMAIFEGEIFRNIDSQMINLNLVNLGISTAALFSPKGEVLQTSDFLFSKSVMIQRGTFRPITKVNEEIMQKGKEQFLKLKDVKVPVFLMEISINTGASKEEIQDVINRIRILNLLGYHTLITNLKLYHELKTYIRQQTNNLIALVMGASHLQELFSQEFYQETGGILAAFSELFDDKTLTYVYPYKESNEVCITVENFVPSCESLKGLYNFLCKQYSIQDISGCKDIEASCKSSTVRKLLKEKNPEWKSMVPDSVVSIIESENMFND